jgi:hypothetical protein
MNTRWLRLLCAGALALSPLLAHAQYSWIDDKGARVFSDQPPPPGTPPGRILKTPRAMEPAQAAEPVNQTPAVPDWVKREQEYKKRAALREAAEKQAEQTRKLAHMPACVSARNAKSELDSGRRLARVTKDGGREFLSDEEIARLREQSSRALANCN